MSDTRSGSRTLLLIHSHYGALPGLFELALRRDDAIVVRERDLTPGYFDAAKGLITTSHLDQIGFMAYREQLAALMARGGRWFYNGHILRPFLDGLRAYVPIPNAKRADYALTRLFDHPIFAGIEQRRFDENRGVAGFYGRGHNPLPDGATPVNGIGPARLPVDWEWRLPGGGRMFSHAGNDVGGTGEANPAHEEIAPRIIAWTAGDLDR